MKPAWVDWNALRWTESVRVGERGVCGAHQVVQDGDGEIQHAHLDRLSESSVQVEQRLGVHASDGWLLSTTPSKHTKNQRVEKKPKKKRELPATDLWLCLSLKTDPVYTVAPSRFQQLHSLPFPRLVFPPPLTFTSSSSAPSPGNVLTVGSCFLVSQSSGRYCPTAQLLRTIPCCNAQAKRATAPSATCKRIKERTKKQKKTRTESRRQDLLFLQQFNQGRRTESVWLLQTPTVWVSPLGMNQPSHSWILLIYLRSSHDPSYLKTVFFHLRCKKNPVAASLLTFFSWISGDVCIQRSNVRDYDRCRHHYLICLFAAAAFVERKIQIKAHRFCVFFSPGFLHSATVINHPNSTSWFWLCIQRCSRVHVHIHEWHGSE